MFGFTLCGQKPAMIEKVDKNSPCDYASMYPNDLILSIDGISLDDKSHLFLVELLKSAGNRTYFDVILLSLLLFNKFYKKNFILGYTKVRI